VIVVAIALVAPAAQTPAKPISTCFGQTATIVGSRAIFGTRGDDGIVGSSEADVIQALEGNDRVCALGDDDILRGGPGNDFVDAGDGDDRITGE
jgi:Ca2+-binding RTX toxin-like protein